MPDLFDWTPHKQARGSDPSTSRVSAERAQFRAGSHKELIFSHLSRIYPASQTYEEISQSIGLPGWTVTKRCSDLLRDGFIEVALAADGSEILRQCNGSPGRCYRARGDRS